jgi:hypothetical protein
MVLTGGNTTTFFEDPAHMGIPHATVIQLQQEGIIIVDDIADFEKERSSKLLLTCVALQVVYPTRMAQPM